MAKGKIISIHSFRGGTGKSNVTANLAAQVAIKGYRVGIMDTDIQSPGIHVLFGLDEASMGHTLNEYLRDECTIEQAAYPIGEQRFDKTGLGKLSGKDLWLVPSSIKTDEISKVVKEGYDVNKLVRGMKELRKNLSLDFLFVDTHPGVNEETLLSLAMTDILLLILRPDQQDFQGTAVMMDVARSLEVPELYLLINKVPTSFDMLQVRAEAESKYDARVIGVIPQEMIQAKVPGGVLPLDITLVELGSADVFSLAYPEHNWSKAVISAAEALIKARE